MIASATRVGRRSVPKRPPCVARTLEAGSPEKMAKKKTKLTAEFWRKDAEQRASAERILAILREEREQKS
jgi:hypothetical protein